MSNKESNNIIDKLCDELQPVCCYKPMRGFAKILIITAIYTLIMSLILGLSANFDYRIAIFTSIIFFFSGLKSFMICVPDDRYSFKCYATILSSILFIVFLSFYNELTANISVRDIAFMGIISFPIFITIFFLQAKGYDISGLSDRIHGAISAVAAAIFMFNFANIAPSINTSTILVAFIALPIILTSISKAFWNKI